LTKKALGSNSTVTDAISTLDFIELRRACIDSMSPAPGKPVSTATAP
jgi:hypothetical protein